MHGSEERHNGLTRDKMSQARTSLTLTLTLALAQTLTLTPALTLTSQTHRRPHGKRTPAEHGGDAPGNA